MTGLNFYWTTIRRSSLQQNGSGAQGMNTELKVGMLAMVINVEYSKNNHLIGTTVLIDSLLSTEESDEYILGANGHAYASYIQDNVSEHYIRQKYLMPLPPLGDVYDQEMMDEMENTKIYTHN